MILADLFLFDLFFFFFSILASSVHRLIRASLKLQTAAQKPHLKAVDFLSFFFLPSPSRVSKILKLPLCSQGFNEPKEHLI